MNDQTNPIVSTDVQTSVPAPTTVPPPISVMPPARPASSKRWLWITLVAFVVLAGAAYGWMTVYPSTPSGNVPASPSPSVSTTVTPVVNAPGVKTFSSQVLGIRFNYLTDQGSPVVEEGDTVYVAGKQGQWVRVFPKAPGDDLKTAITKKFLAGVPAGKCIVSITAEDKNPDILFGNINVDFEPTDPGDPRLASSPCPAEYRVTNGIRYFYMDSNHPDRFFFFSIGQYAIFADNKDVTWQDTFEVVDLSVTTSPTAGWKTYTNTLGEYSYQFPPTWNAVTSSHNAAVSLFGRDAVATMGVGGVELIDYPGTVIEYMEGVDALWAPEQSTWIDGIPAFRATFTSSVGRGTAYYLKTAGTIVNIYMHGEDKEQVALFDKLVSTFKFTK